MSAKQCCIKIKNCDGKAQGMAQSQVFLVEQIKPENFTPELERKIVSFWDRFLAEMEDLEKALFKASEEQ